MAFMISRERDNISSVDDVINAFKALAENSERPYITREELRSVSYPLKRFVLNQLIDLCLLFNLESTTRPGRVLYTNDDSV